MNKFKFLSHTADAKFQAWGKTAEEAFENSARAMFSLLVQKQVNPDIKKKIKLYGKDKEALLYNFLEELLFLFDSEQFLFSKVEKIKIKKEKTDYVLEAEISGDKTKGYKISGDVKAITYNSMFVKTEKGKVTCQVVLDI